MIISVVGASGFIGLELVKKLINSGNQIRILSRNKYYPIKGVKVFVADLTDPNIDIDDFLDNVDILYNCAGEVKNESLMRGLHVDGTKRLLDRSREKVARWVQLSSVGAYGACHAEMITENSVENPVGNYEITKTEADDLIRESGMRYVILRPSNVFGLTMSNQSLFQLVKIVHKNLFFYIGNSEALVNYVHVNDVVKALILCGSSDDALGDTFILSQTIEVEQMINSFRNDMDFRRKPFCLPEWPIRKLLKIFIFLYRSSPLTMSRVDALTGHCRYNSTKIIDTLGFEFNSSLEDNFIYFSSNLSDEK
jgi:nucleoside-diphosphate-sugar epimerase